MGGTIIRYNIRQLAEHDLELMLEWRNSEHVRTNMFSDQLITLEQHLTWYRKMNESGSSIYLVFEYEKEPCGIVNFSQLDSYNRKCNWGFYLGREGLPRGTGTLMCTMGVKYAFEQLDIRKICGEVLATNTSSIRVHEKIGFQQEGYFKQHIRKNDSYVDVLAYALFPEYLSKVEMRI
jgi:UDP-4-amino-4,6-dideoxy-N-acetyl-beta-L-altrosamine N-acetyltransferase